MSVVGEVVSARGVDLGAIESRELAAAVRVCVDPGLVAEDLPRLPPPPPVDCLAADKLALLVEAGGAMRGFPAVLNLDFELESDVRAVVAGVPVRGVEVVELADDGVGFVGDFVGDFKLRVSQQFTLLIVRSDMIYPH